MGETARSTAPADIAAIQPAHTAIAQLLQLKELPLVFECGDQLMETTTRVLKPGEGGEWEGQSSIRWRVAWCCSVFERVRGLDEGIDSTTHTDKWNH